MRGAKSLDASVLGVRVFNSCVRGRLEGKWISLTDEPGFMLAVDGAEPLLVAQVEELEREKQELELSWKDNG